VIGENCACSLELEIISLNERLCYSDNGGFDWNCLSFTAIMLLQVRR